MNDKKQDSGILLIGHGSRLPYNKEVIDKYFTNTVSRVEGIGMEEIGEGVEWKHDQAFEPLGLGVEGAAHLPEAVEEGLLLLDAGAGDELPRDVLLGLGGYGIEGVEVGVEPVLVGVAADEGGGEVANLLTLDTGVGAEEGELLVEHQLVVGIAEFDDEVVVARREPLDVERAIDGDGGLAVLAAGQLLPVVARAGLLLLYVGEGEEGLAARLAPDVVDLVVEVELPHLLGHEVADVRLEVVAAAREDVLGLGGRGRGDELDGGDGRARLVVVDDHLLGEHRGVALGILVAQRQLEVVDAVADREALEVDEGEVKLVERADGGAVQVVLLEEADGVALAEDEDDLGGGTVGAVGALDKLHGPGIEREVGLDIRRLLVDQEEGAVAEEGLQALLGPCGEREQEGQGHDGGTFSHNAFCILL